jgi:hypothetical protein
MKNAQLTPFTKFEWVLIIAGAVILRVVIKDNSRYMLAAMFYGVMVGIGREIFRDLDEE